MCCLLSDNVSPANFDTIQQLLHTIYTTMPTFTDIQKQRLAAFRQLDNDRLLAYTDIVYTHFTQLFKSLISKPKIESKHRTDFIRSCNDFVKVIKKLFYYRYIDNEPCVHNRMYFCSVSLHTDDMCTFLVNLCSH